MQGTGQRLAVIVCSVGRPDCLSALLPALDAQSRRADRIVFVVTEPKDIDPGFAQGTGNGTTEVLMAPKGLPRQRNAGLDAVADDCDLVLFLDDDFVPSIHTLAGVETGFALWPEVGGMTGHLIADGIRGEGIGADEAARMVAQWDESTSPAGPERKPRILQAGLEGLYGCNMAYRMSAIGDNRFDERLPLYGWQEDIDFAARITGDRVKTDAFAGVHRGAKSGRETAGHRLGYSQIANPWYLWRKGTMSARFAGKLAVRNLLANHAKMLRPEPWIDRRARARGNRLAIGDILTGSSDPERILDL